MRKSLNAGQAAVVVAVVAVLLSSPLGFTQDPAPRPLTWGADSEGGAPYEFPDPQDPSKIIGFEVDIVEAIGRILGRPAQFVQNQWDGLIPGLERGNYDIVVSGLEITPDRAQVINFSRPYYVTFERISVRSETNDIQSLEDMKGRKVGTLKGSMAHRILDARGDIVVLSYDGQVNVYEDLANGRLDAVLLDDIIALYNVPLMPRLKTVGSPIGRLEYGIGIRKEDSALLSSINSALEQMIASGELRGILERWNLWTPVCAEFFGDRSPGTRRADAYERYLESRAQRPSFAQRVRQYISYLPLLIKGAVVTVELSVAAMALAVALGLLVALGRLYGPLPLYLLATSYIEV